MADDEELSDQFLTAYVCTIADGCGLDFNLRPEQIPFVESVVLQLLHFNAFEDMTTYAKLRGIMRVIRSAKMG